VKTGQAGRFAPKDEPAADDPYDEHQPVAGEKPLSLEQLIASTDHGVLMQTNRSWSIDDKRYNFQFGCEIGWEIKGGKRVRMVKNRHTRDHDGVLEFAGRDLLADEWTLWGTPNCGKGQPQQVMGRTRSSAVAVRGLRWAQRSRANSPQRHREPQLKDSMLTKETAGDIFDRIKKLSSADEVEVLFRVGGSR